MISRALRENIRIAWKSIASQKLRAILTILIIALGIMALVGIFASTDNLKALFTREFSSMGSNTFTIKTQRSGNNSGGKTRKNFEVISYDDAKEFKNKFTDGDLISISARVSQIATLKYGSEKTNPNITLTAGDENYLSASGYALNSGRNFSKTDLVLGSRVVILGNDVIKKIFVNNEDPINKFVLIGSQKYKVIGELESKGNSFGFAGDNLAIIPLGTFKLNYGTARSRYAISIVNKKAEDLDDSIESATGLFRVIRKDRPGEEPSFRISKSDSVAKSLLEMLSFLEVGAVVIAIITLFGATIGLMNIMLVSVSERTREIGLRKSLGATNKTIMYQFLFESIIIGQLGGLVGIILGLIAGLIVGGIMGAFVFPWPWIIMSVFICIVVSILSGIYPATKASKLDPIESLRHI